MRRDYVDALGDGSMLISKGYYVDNVIPRLVRIVSNSCGYGPIRTVVAKRGPHHPAAAIKLTDELVERLLAHHAALTAGGKDVPTTPLEVVLWQ